MLDNPGKRPAETSREGELPSGERRSLPGNVLGGLSGRLLVLTIIFVMIAEVLIFLPSVANFRNVWLQSHLDTAEAASIVYLDGSDIMLSETAQGELLKATQSLSVSIRERGMSRLMAASPNPSMVSEEIDLAGSGPFSSLTGALGTLFFGGDRVYQVYGPMKSRDAEIHLVQEDRYLRTAMLVYARNILYISLAISLITAGLVFLALYGMIVRPIIRLSWNMDAFSRNPENHGLVYKPTGRQDEIGVAEERLAALQSDLQDQLRQKQHLADLGLAVSKINHDLRNILASAQLFSDRLTQLPDPAVQKFAPKLVRTLNRAIGYTQSVLSYGKAVEAKPAMRRHRLSEIVEEVGDTLGIGQGGVIQWHNAVPVELAVRCDAEQLFRVLLNLSRNALQAMEGRQAGRIEISAVAAQGHVDIRVRDAGPGIPEAHRASLFKPFQGSSRSDGTGLGLAIAAEIVRIHGGSIELEETGAAGSTFRVRLPHHDAA